jgi:hypothetical protein
MLGRDGTRAREAFHGRGGDERADEHQDTKHGAAYRAPRPEATRAA